MPPGIQGSVQIVALAIELGNGTFWLTRSLNLWSINQNQEGEVERLS